MFTQRIQAQFKQLQAFVASLNIDRDETVVDNDDQKNGEELTRDQFDLRKIIVIVTASGKLFGLDTIGKVTRKNPLTMLLIKSKNSGVERRYKFVPHYTFGSTGTVLYNMHVCKELNILHCSIARGR